MLSSTFFVKLKKGAVFFSSRTIPFAFRVQMAALSFNLYAFFIPLFDRKVNKGFSFLVKAYVLLVSLLSIGLQTFVTAKYSLESNVGVVICSLPQQILQFILLLRRGTCDDEVIGLLTSASLERVKKLRVIMVLSYIAYQFVLVTSAFGCLIIFGPAEVFLVAFGNPADSRQFNSFAKFWLVFVFLHNLVNSIGVLGVFSLRYTKVAHAISLLAEQNLTHLNNLVFDGVTMVPVDPKSFVKIEQMYLTYREVLEKLNSIYGLVPLWLLLILYTSITATGSYAVICRDSFITWSMVSKNLAFCSLLVTFVLYWTHLSSRSYNLMENFRQKGLLLINCRLKRARASEPLPECLANTLKGIPLLKMRVLQIYDLEHSLLISLIASAIPTTVMVVSLLKGVN